MAGEIETTPMAAPSPGAEASAPATESGPPAWFVEYQQQADKRFAGLAEKLASSRAPEPAPVADKKKAAPPPITQADVDASMRLGELRGALPEAARAALDDLKKGGMSVAQVAMVAEKMAGLGASQDSTPPANGIPTGKAANAAPSTAMRFPSTMSEMQALLKSDAKAYQAVVDHPDFDHTKIPNR